MADASVAVAKAKKAGKRKAATARPSQELKKEVVSELAKLMKKSKTIGVIDLRNLPDRQFSLIKKKLRGKAEFVVAKNTLIKKAFEKAKVAEGLVSRVNAPSALVFTDLNPFELFRFIKQNKGKAAAKPGQIAPFDLIVPAGETTLPPGPVLSELKSAKIDARIQEGKVVIGKDSLVAKKGEKIGDLVAKGLQKLGIQPFEVGMNLVAAFDGVLIYLREVMDVDEEKLMAELASGYLSALNLSVEVGYPTRQNIEIMLVKAVRNARGLAIEANIYDKEVIDQILAKAKRAHDALAVNVKEAPATVPEVAPAPDEVPAAPAASEEKKEG